MKRIIAVWVLAIGCAATLFAHTSVEVEKTCHLCDTKFKTRMDASGTSFGMRLDLKKLGPIASPRSVAVCPNCHYVLLGDDLTEDELAKCRQVVESKEYKEHSGRASYFLLALLYEGLGRESLDIAHTYLKASWQEENDEKHLKEDLGMSLKNFEAYLKEGPPKKADGKTEEKAQDENSAYDTARLLKGELLRRLGRFEEARKYLQALLEEKQFQSTFFGDIVRYQIKLCVQKDAKPHEISEVEKTKISEQPPEHDK